MELVLTALLMGLAGAGHCAAMCGSLTVAAGFSIPKHRSFFVYGLFMSLGRVFGYGLVGLCFHLVAVSLLSFSNGLLLMLPIIASVLMFGVGLHILRINQWILKTEKIGVLIDPLLIPLKKKLFPIDTIPKAIGYGFLWGFLPCGLVYSALSLAITAPDAAFAFLVMFMFGLGTLPTLVGLTAFSAKINVIINHKGFRTILGSALLVLAAIQFYNAVSLFIVY